MDSPIKNGGSFHSYVSLPEDKIPVNPIKPPFSYGFPMVFPWFSHGSNGSAVIVIQVERWLGKTPPLPISSAAITKPQGLGLPRVRVLLWSPRWSNLLGNLVVDPPLWKIWESQLGWFFPISIYIYICGKNNRNVPNHKPEMVSQVSFRWSSHLSLRDLNACGADRRTIRSVEDGYIYIYI